MLEQPVGPDRPYLRGVVTGVSTFGIDLSFDDMYMRLPRQQGPHGDPGWASAIPSARPGDVVEFIYDDDTQVIGIYLSSTDGQVDE